MNYDSTAQKIFISGVATELSYRRMINQLLLPAKDFELLTDEYANRVAQRYWGLISNG